MIIYGAVRRFFDFHAMDDDLAKTVPSKKHNWPYS